MNIFVIDPCPITCAQALDDLRLNKMIVETAQILSTNLRQTNYFLKEQLYKATHVNHPCVKWARESAENMIWLDDLLFAYLTEYEYRHYKMHKTMQMYITNMPYPDFDGDSNRGPYSRYFPNIPRTPFVNCTPHKDMDVHAAYKLTLKEKWTNDKRQPKWTNRTRPNF